MSFRIIKCIIKIWKLNNHIITFLTNSSSSRKLHLLLFKKIRCNKKSNILQKKVNFFLFKILENFDPIEIEEE